MTKFRLLEYNVLVKMDPTEEKTPGGIILPTATKDKEELANDEGTLAEISEHAFNYADWDAGPPKVGDRVLFARHAGRIYENGGVKYRILKDKDIIMVIEQEAALSVAA